MSPKPQTLIGTDNCEFALRYLERPKGCAASAQDLGGHYPRRIHYSPSTGKVVRRLLRPLNATARSRSEETGTRQDV